MIDRIRLTAAAKIQLSTLKKRTGINHYNSLCRHALCLSLSNKTVPPFEDFNFQGGIEIDWKIFTGGQEDVYLNLIIMRLLAESHEISVENIRAICASHIHRGLSYLLANDSMGELISLGDATPFK